MTQKYKEALSEVEAIINQLSRDDLDKIPESFREFITENKCSWYELKDINNLREETYAILAIMYRKFLAPPEERIVLEREYQEKLKQEKEEIHQLKEKSAQLTNKEIEPATEDVVLEEVEAAQEEVKTLELIEYKPEKWYMKFIDKIKRIFHLK